MKGKPNYYNRCLHILTELRKSYPNQTLGQHIGMALSDYRDVSGITDKEFQFALEKYQLELDMNIAPDIDVEKIYKEGLNLSTVLDEDPEDDF